MQLTAIDHVILPVADLAKAAAPFETLGLVPTAPMRHAGAATDNRAIFVGGGEAEMYIELLGVHDAELARATGRAALLEEIARGGLSLVMLATADLGAAARSLERAGVPATTRSVARADGSKICDVLVPETDRAGCQFAIIQYEANATDRLASHRERGLFGHAFPLKRLDHLAVVAPRLDEITAFWTDVLEVPVFGEVRGRGMIIRQMKVGDAILELLGPDSPESPLASRPAGLISMCAFEVDDLDAAIGLARERGFTLPDATVGVLPRSRVSTIAGDQLSGLSLQLIAFD